MTSDTTTQTGTTESGTGDANGLTVHAFNHRRPIIKPRLSSRELAGLEEIESYYAPSGPVRRVTTYFRTGPGATLHVGHGQYLDFDYVLSRVLGIRGLATGYSSQVYGGGKGLDLHDAYVSSVGEGIERILGSFAFLSWRDRLRYGTYDELTRQGLRCLSPDEVPIFAPSQYADPHFPYDRWERSSMLGWVPGQRLYSGEEVWCPAQLVLFVYYRHSDEPPIGLAPSGGLASHISEEQARLHGLLEVLERDAVNLRWHCKIPVDRIVFDVPPRDPQVRDQIERMQENIGAPSFYFQSMDFPTFPVVTAIQRDGWLKQMAYHAGGGVGTTVDEALRGALGEYCQSERSLRTTHLARNWDFKASFDSLFGIHEDATPGEFARYIQAIPYYGYERRMKETSWFFDDGDEIALSELYARIDAADPDPATRLHKELTARGMDPIMFDFTPKGFGTIKVIRSFIPELTQPYPQSSPALGNSRYQDIPVQTGKLTDPIGEENLSRDAMPYP